ncbi:MAG TPA: hypothetical protein PLN48_08835 [Lachnospiraceae bacterium]|nr:hypothetical protein [Lachnospiraceae bacterium]
MLKWYRNLYIGDSLKKHHFKMIADLNAGRKVFGRYLITFPVNEKNQLEIVNTANLVQKYVYRHTPMIIGIAGSHEEAVEIVLEITKECVRKTGDAEIRNFLEEKISNGM